MAKLIKFYFDDTTTKQIESISDISSFRINIRRDPRVQLFLFKGYIEYPETLILKDFYMNDLSGKNIIKVELYSDDYLIDSFEKAEDSIIKTSWDAGRLQSGDELIQEKISIEVFYIA